MGKLNKPRAIIGGEIQHLHLRFWLAKLLLFPLPVYVGSRVRPLFLRLAGFDIGAGTLFFGTPILTGAGDINTRLTIGRECLVSWGCYLDLQGSIMIGDWVGLSPQISIITSSHSVGSPYNRVGQLQALPVIIKNGVWLGTRCTILPGVTVHEGAVVAAGAVVTKDVPANTIVGGVPARVIRNLAKDEIEVNKKTDPSEEFSILTNVDMSRKV